MVKKWLHLNLYHLFPFILEIQLEYSMFIIITLDYRTILDYLPWRSNYLLKLFDTFILLYNYTFMKDIIVVIIEITVFI